MKALEKEQTDKTKSVKSTPKDVNLDIEMASDGVDDEEQKMDIDSDQEEEYQVNLGGGLNAESGDNSDGNNDDRASSEGYDALCGQKRSYN